MKKIVLSLLTLAILFSTTSCATIFGSHKSSNLTVESSTPIRVKLVSDEGMVINKTTPFSIHELDRSSSYTLKINSDDYYSDDIYIGKKLRPLAILNLICALCWVIDFVTGNMWDHKQHYVFIDVADLERKKAMNLPEFKTEVSVLIKGADEDIAPAEMKAHRTVKFRKQAV